MKFIKKNSPLIFFCIFLVFNILFNWEIVRGIIFFDKTKIPINDGVVTTFLIESGYQKLLGLSNPFHIGNKILYPFETNSAMSDSALINLPFFLILRPIMDPIRVLWTIAFLNLCLTYIFTYFFLRLLKIKHFLAFYFSLIFALTPFISYRIQGHYTFTATYFFPLISIIIYHFTHEKTVRKKYLFAILLGTVLGLLLYANPTYLIFSMLCLMFLHVYFLLSKFHSGINFIRNKKKYYIVIVTFLLLIIVPWIKELPRLTYFSSIYKQTGFEGSIELSADLVSFIIPSEFNVIYDNSITLFKKAGGSLEKIYNFYFYNWERFSYPGIILILFYLGILVYRKRLSKELKITINPYFYTSLFFLILSLGPFLKIFNKWFVTVDESINIYFPLPYLILHFIPILNFIRAPARFIIMFVYLGVIVSALVSNYYVRFIKKKRILLISLIGILIFLIDQNYFTFQKYYKLPFKAYEMIKKDPEESTVLEIPFTLRDGIQYIGDVHATSILIATLYHGKPIIGGYLPRVNPWAFAYYRKLPFVSYIAQIIDKGNYNPYKEKPKDTKIIAFSQNSQSIKDELDFLDIKYILLKSDEKYSGYIKKILFDIGSNEILKDQNYSLFERKLAKKNFVGTAFNSSTDYFYTAEGFSLRDDGFRWIEGKTAKVFFKDYNSKSKILNFETESFHQPQNVKIYLNNNYVTTLLIKNQKSKFRVDIRKSLKTGLNTVWFKFEKNFNPVKVLPGSLDKRNLSVKMYSFKVE